MLGNVDYIHADRAVPEMTVFELAIASALSRKPDHDDRDLLTVLSDWFQRPISGLDLNEALDRMEQRDLVYRNSGQAADRLTERGKDQFTALYGASIRMIDRGMNLLRVGLILNMMEYNGKESGHD